MRPRACLVDVLKRRLRRPLPQSFYPDRDGLVLDAAPLPEAIALEPTFHGLKLVAWSADDGLLPRGGERGFPHWAVWAERNKRFTADVAAFMAADLGACGEPGGAAGSPSARRYSAV
jgi:hypothetical protein